MPGCSRLATAGLVALALTAGAGSPAAPTVPSTRRDPQGPRFVEGEILVRFRRDVPAASRGALRFEVAGATQRRFASGTELWRLGPGLSVTEALERLEGSAAIEYAEPNYLLHATRTPDDPLFPQQHSLLNTGQEGGTEGADIDAVGAWDVSTGGASVVVAVIDSGIDLDHPDLRPNLWTNPDEIPGNLVDDDGNGLVDDVHGWDFVNQDNDPHDDTGHGTHVAGTIAAAGDNGLGIAGVAWRARLMPLKFLDSGGFGTTSDAIQAIDYAVAKGARILNASWGGEMFSMATLESIRNAGTHEALFVAAAGNDAADLDRIRFYPASYEAGNIVTVAATDRHDALAAFSNFGRTSVDLAAPGVGILSTLPGGAYGLSSGTSMATPHVSGVAALLLGLAPSMGAESLRKRILDHAEPVAALADRVAASARVNAWQCFLDRDASPPGPIVDLRVIEPLSDGLVLGLTATGDDSDSGAAVAYDLRISEAPFDTAGFASAPRFPWPGSPRASGSPETEEIGGLEPSRTYHVGLRAMDEWGNAGPPGFATATTRPPPRLEATPEFSSVELRSGQTTTRVLTLHNASEGTLDWSVALPVLRPILSRGAQGTESWGGPDSSGYVFIDSDEPDGPVFAWRDITPLGHSAVVAGGDDVSAPIPLGFAFPFYGQVVTSVQVARNGYLTFTPAPEAVDENQSLPSPGAPGNLVAGFWENLSLSPLSRVLWFAEPHVFTVQFNGLMRTNGGGPYTFQIVLFDSGEILFQYLRMEGLGFSETIGIQDDSGTTGLPISFNTPYVHDQLAVRLLMQKAWVSAAPRSGRLRPGESVPVGLTFDASGLTPGGYEGRLPILTNDPERRRVEMPVAIAVEGARAIAVEPAVVDFGSIVAAWGARFGLTIVNSGTLPLTIAAVIPEDPTVLVDVAPFTLAPGARRQVTVAWQPAGPGTLLGSLRIESDAQNAPSLPVPLTGIALNIPPRAAAIWPPDVECSGPEGSDVVLDASSSLDEDGGASGIVHYEWLENPGAAGEALLGTGVRIARKLPFGTHRLGLRVTDRHGAIDTVEGTVRVVDTIPPMLSVRVSPAVLWPPRHRMVPVRLTLSARDSCSGKVTVRLTGISSSESDDAPGNRDGQTTGDIAGAEAGTPDTGLLLRAERSKDGPGRVYTIRYVATDPAGNDTPREAFVTVPARRDSSPLIPEICTNAPESCP